ncbi:hypothetical protein LOTGIDRAFT_236518, partial [Lottia gigantea]
MTCDRGQANNTEVHEDKTGVLSYQCAKYEKLFDRQPTYITCSFDCCGISSNRHCCTPVWIVLLFVVLGIAVVGITALTVYCLLKRSKKQYAKKHATGFGKYPEIRRQHQKHHRNGSHGGNKPSGGNGGRNARRDKEYEAREQREYEQREMSTFNS